MAMANGAMKATPSVEQVSVANTSNAQKRKSSHIPVPSSKLSYVKPRQYKSTLKKDNSTGNCSKGSISLSPGPPNDDSGIGMDHSVEVSECSVISCPSDLTETGKAEQESLRALQRAVAEMEADLNIIESDGDAISDSDGDTVTAENVNHCKDPDPEKEVQNAVIEKVDQLQPESLLPPQQLLVVPVVLQEEDTPQAPKSPQQPHEMVEEILQNQKGLNSENEREVVEEWLQNLIHGAVEDDQMPPQDQHDDVLPSTYKTVEKNEHEDVLPPLMSHPVEDIMPQGQHDEEKAIEMATSISVPVGEIQKEAADGIVEHLQLGHLDLDTWTALTSEAVESNSNTAEEVITQEEQPTANALTTAEAMMDLQEQFLANTNGDDEESVHSDLDGRQNRIQDLTSYVNDGMTLKGDTCVRVIVSTKSSLENILQLQDERPQTTLNEMDEISELQQDQDYGQLQSNSNAVEEILELQQEKMDEANGLPSTSKQVVGLQQMQQVEEILELQQEQMDEAKGLPSTSKQVVGLQQMQQVEEILELQQEQMDEAKGLPSTSKQVVGLQQMQQVEEILELQQEQMDEAKGLPSTSKQVVGLQQMQQVEEILELQQEQMDEANGLPSTSKQVVGVQQMQQLSTSWLLEKFIQTLDNEKNAEQIKKLLEEIIKLQNEQPEELPPNALQPEQHEEMELSQEVETVSSPRRSCSHSPLLGMAGLRALEGYLDDGILRHLMQQEQEENIVLPARSEEALVEQEDNLVDVETIQEKPCCKNAGHFRALLQQLRAYKMPTEIIPLALFGTAFCLFLFFRKF
ncbi:uncharacterized protein LOC111074200 isoform X2 [Drosophila obscura]|uniref:uncharacterized protein LOC111074200 isoform X2 n=1 Tax=Drosophila obscura TaxID=7282 RepID=UPI001BB18EDB|nr:uncharacterized protein LOC111074200 isoform X2 [Drosophila obscura]